MGICCFFSVISHINVATQAKTAPVKAPNPEQTAILNAKGAIVVKTDNVSLTEKFVFNIKSPLEIFAY